ncbi:MAG: hypothetical protein HY541_09335 [Deltaproteobacteria bacterium]|nr:hypothetical protein [Deltaproteobacteria bacterium]
MKKIPILIFSFLIVSAISNADSANPNSINPETEMDTGPIAGSGCCSWHGGACGCSLGQVVCCDGTYSPSCDCNADSPQSPVALTCEPEGNVSDDRLNGTLLAQGTTYVNPYIRSDGTYVQGHYKTSSDSTRLNNWSTKGNINPYTGKEGTQNPYPTYNSNFRSKPLNIGNTYPRYDSDASDFDRE